MFWQCITGLFFIIIFAVHLGCAYDVLKCRQPTRFGNGAIESYAGFYSCMWGGGEALWSLNRFVYALIRSLSFCVNLSPVCTRACVNRGLKGTDMSAKQKHALKIKPPKQIIIENSILWVILQNVWHLHPILLVKSFSQYIWFQNSYTENACFD